MADSAYETIRKSRCEWCAKSLENITPKRHVVDGYPVHCTAPSEEQAIEEQAAEIATLQKRVEELEKVIRAAQEDGLRLYTATKEDNDRLTRQLEEERARLDWVEAYVTNRERRPDLNYCVAIWDQKVFGVYPASDFSTGSIREAIDAARNAAKEQA